MKAHCRCPSPPGGSVTCDTHQVAFCKVVGGETFSGCLTPPAEEAVYAIRKPERALLELLSWTLEEIEFSLSRSGPNREAMLRQFVDMRTYAQWFEQIREGTPLELEGWVLVGGEFHRARVAIRVPQEYGDPKLVHEYGYAPA